MKNKKLHNIKKTGFKTPDHYFESLEDNIINKLNKTSLSDIKSTGFNLPNDYFDTLEDTIINNLKEEKTVKVIPLFSRKNVLYVSSIAAVVLIMLGIFINKHDSIDSLDIEMVESYIEQQDLSSYELASLLTEEDLSEENFGIINDTFSEESLENYLIENTNLEDIIEQ